VYDTEKIRSSNLVINWSRSVVFPEPDGAETIYRFPRNPPV
jgi:hypothetical protein